MSPGSSAVPYFRSRRRGGEGGVKCRCAWPDRNPGEKDANGNEDEQRVGGGGKVNKGKGRSGTGGGGSRKNEERRSQAASVWRKTMEVDMSRDVFNEQMQCGKFIYKVRPGGRTEPHAQKLSRSRENCVHE